LHCGPTANLAIRSRAPRRADTLLHHRLLAGNTHQARGWMWCQSGPVHRRTVYRRPLAGSEDTVLGNPHSRLEQDCWKPFDALFLDRQHSPRRPNDAACSGVKRRLHRSDCDLPEEILAARPRRRAIMLACFDLAEPAHSFAFDSGLARLA
jgi:hypothetical protein